MVAAQKISGGVDSFYAQIFSGLGKYIQTHQIKYEGEIVLGEAQTDEEGRLTTVRAVLAEKIGMNEELKGCLADVEKGLEVLEESIWGVPVRVKALGVYLTPKGWAVYAREEYSNKTAWMFWYF